LERLIKQAPNSKHQITNKSIDPVKCHFVAQNYNYRNKEKKKEVFLGNCFGHSVIEIWNLFVILEFVIWDFLTLAEMPKLKEKLCIQQID